LLKLKIDGYWEKVSQGGTMQILGVRMLKETPFPHIGLLEQTGIATVLNDMDSEIDKLEQKLVKYKMLKQGMMQVLLTGKIRLV
jgi:type I restriction enzyme S subunit